MDVKTLESHNTCVFKGSFYNKHGKKAGVVMISDTFFALHQRRDCKEIFNLVGLKDFYRLPPWGIDIRQSFELMTSITKEGVAQMTNKDDEVVQVQITDRLINEALHFKADCPSLVAQLMDSERKATFLGMTGQVNTFKDLVCKEVEIPLRVHTQHFTTGKQHRHTQPSVRMAYLFTRAHMQGTYQYCNYGKLVLDTLTTYSKSKGFCPHHSSIMALF